METDDIIVSAWMRSLPDEASWNNWIKRGGDVCQSGWMRVLKIEPDQYFTLPELQLLLLTFASLAIMLVLRDHQSSPVCVVGYPDMSLKGLG